MLFGELPRRDGVGALWSHQVDQLRDYQPDHLDTLDAALRVADRVRQSVNAGCSEIRSECTCQVDPVL
jgi:hypothetical protein